MSTSSAIRAEGLTIARGLMPTPTAAARRAEILDDAGEGLMDVGHGDGGHRQPVRRKAGGDNGRPGVSGRQFFSLLVAIDKGDVARTGIQERRRAKDLDGSFADEPPFDQTR